jgi:putative transposase
VAQPQPLPKTGRSVGIDVGLKHLYTTSEGEQAENPRWYRQAQKRLRMAQRRVARRKKGGKNRQKAIVLLQRQHERLANQRKDALNKLAHALIERYDVIALEDLAISGMVHGNLAKSILDVGWGYLSAPTFHAQGCTCRSCDRVSRSPLHFQNLLQLWARV